MGLRAKDRLPVGSIGKVQIQKHGGTTMRTGHRITLMMGIGFGLMIWPHIAAAQACKDEQSMVDESKKSLVEVVNTVKQESLPDFERSYHQKNVINKLSFYGTSVESLLACEDKAAQDSSAAKDAADAARAKHDGYAKLKDKIQHDHDALKALTAPKDAKAYAEKLDEVT
jgi:hypothetical protein